MAGGPGNDRFYGGAGNDNMIVDDGQDTLTGGAGADEFVIASVDRDILGKFLPHLITDFRHGEDLIDVSIADAKSSVAGNNVFSFVGTQAPSAEGQLGYTVLGGVTRVWINETSGTPERHVILELTGSIALTADDFVL
jgi:Ca2+-binding RTX toxin-like protein